MVGKLKIAYIGLDPFTLLILLKELRFEVAGVSLLSDFFSVTFNPVNLLFEFIYYLRVKNRFRYLELLALYSFKFLKFFTSSFFKKYRHYLIEISKRRITIFDDLTNSEASEFLRQNEIDVVIVNCWGIISKETIKIPRLGMVNIHPSKLPQYKGALPTLWSLKNGDKQSAVTYMLLDDSIDGGKILKQTPFEISQVDDAISLEEKIKGILKEDLNSTITDYACGKIIPVQQSNKNASKTDRYSDYMKIDWEKESGRDICNKINLYPYIDPNVYCYTLSFEKKIFVKDAEFIAGAVIFENAKPGQYKNLLWNILFQTRNDIIKCRRVFFK